MPTHAVKRISPALQASQTEFCENLRLACGYYRSVADVCRKLNINRAQFNRYLNGTTKPSSFILQKICNFFGVEPAEIYLHRDQFSKLIEVRQEQLSPRARYVEHVQRLQQLSQGKFEKYLGYYFEYYQSRTVYGRVVRGLVRMFKEGNAVYYERIERGTERGGVLASTRFRYLGCAHYLNDRIFLTDYDVLGAGDVTQIVLYPDYKTRVRNLSGLMLGVSSGNQRAISSSRIVFEYLGTTVDLGKMVRQCGILDPHAAHIDPHILRVIDNSVHVNPYHFFPLED